MNRHPLGSLGWACWGAFTWLLVACQSGLPTSLDGLACDAHDNCSSGYHCELTTRTCVRACRNGETVCDQSCVVLKQDPQNCGGCGATCTAPLHAQPGCSDG